MRSLVISSIFLQQLTLDPSHSANISATFDPPEGQAPYDYVFDLTGEVRQDRPEQVSLSSLMRSAMLP